MTQKLIATQTVHLRFIDDFSFFFGENLDVSRSRMVSILRSNESLLIDVSQEVFNLDRLIIPGLGFVSISAAIEQAKSITGNHNVTVLSAHPDCQTFKTPCVFKNNTYSAYLATKTKHASPIKSVEKTFLSFNNYPRPHRIQLVKFLCESGISANTHYSFSPNRYAHLDSSLSHLRRSIDTEFSSGHEVLATLGSTPDVWNRTAISIVSETVFDHLIFFPTEKTWKVFDNFHVPVFLSSVGFVNQLRTMGFDVFDDIVDHTYDSIVDNDCRIGCVFAEIKRLNTLDTSIVNTPEIQRRLLRNHYRVHCNRGQNF